MTDNLKVSPDEDPEADLGEGGVFLPLAGRIVYPKDDRVLRFLREGWFEYLELTMMSRLVRPGDYFVDVGAHCGLYSKLAAHRMKGIGTIVAVEPNPALHPFIRRNLEIAHVSMNGDVKVGEKNLIGGAVAIASNTALLQVGDSGWTAYSTLNSASNPHLTRSIPVTTYTLESLIAEVGEDQQVIVKLDTEGLEYEILAHAASHLARRDRIHLMIEFDENNLAAGNHSTAGLVELIEGMGYTLAMFDRQTERLVPFESREPLWGANLVATKDLGLLNGRLGNLDKVVVAETEDFLRRGEVAERIYRNSENLRKTLKSSMEMAVKIAKTTSVLEGSPEIEGQIGARLAAARERPEVELPSALLELLTDELARLEGTARGVAKQLDSTRKAMHRAQEEIGALDARLADQRRVIVSARAELQGGQDSVAEADFPAVHEDGHVAHALKLSEKMADDIGMLIGAARWLAEEVSKSRRNSERNNLPMEGADSDAGDHARSGELTLAQLTDSPEPMAELDAAIATLESLPEADRLLPLSALALDQSGDLIDAAGRLAGHAVEGRRDVQRLEELLAQANAALADQARTVAGAVARVSDNPKKTAELESATSSLESLPATDRLPSLTALVADWSGRLIGAADSLVVQIEEARAEARRLGEGIAKADAEIGRLKKRAEQERKEREQLTTDLEAASREAETLAGDLELVRRENEQLACEKTKAVDSLSVLRDETTEAGRVLAPARLNLMKLIAETSLSPESKTREDALALQQKVKAGLSEAAWRLAFGSRQADGLVSEAAADPAREDMLAEMDRLRLENRELAADIHRIGALLVNARRSQWLRLGRRVGADLAAKLDKAASVLEEADKRGKKAPAGGTS